MPRDTIIMAQVCAISVVGVGPGQQGEGKMVPCPALPVHVPLVDIFSWLMILALKHARKTCILNLGDIFSMHTPGCLVLASKFRLLFVFSGCCKKYAL